MSLPRPGGGGRWRRALRVRRWSYPGWVITPCSPRLSRGTPRGVHEAQQLLPAGVAPVAEVFRPPAGPLAEAEHLPGRVREEAVVMRLVRVPPRGVALEEGREEAPAEAHAR